MGVEKLFPKNPKPPELSNLEGEGGDCPSLTESESKLEERCGRDPAGLGATVAPMFAFCTRFVRLPKLGDRLRRPKKPPPSESPRDPEGLSFWGRSFKFPMLELLFRRFPTLPANGSESGELENIS